ncbi:hypothetical protein PIB30_043817 [Stylosanthes scabra]|uniref:Uncharacterized protein n=1 Tax=Stylosanthes scabra TaxID=79078 RepID=A0ABU6UFX4_9FABA|nr:hypothetical protein [Stylosanthes scabra]
MAERWYERQSSYWKQVSRSKFASQMNRNTGFFHAIAKDRKRRKIIEVLKIEGRCYRGKAVVKKIVSLQTRFFWGNGEGRGGMAGVKWEVIQRPKSLGGLGVRNIELKNLS